MTKKLVWPASLLASFALAAACGGGTTPDGEGGEGGTDGDTGGTSTGGTSTGGSAVGGLGGQGGLGGGGPIVIRPKTCSDGLINEDETDVDCGGPDCDPCEADASCEVGADCASGICDEVCVAADCGDGVVNGEEECDQGRETSSCNADCTFTRCGDGYLNAQAEVCEPDPDLDIWQRCGPTCIVGMDFNGTWQTAPIPQTSTPWERLVGPTVESNGILYPYSLIALPTYHYRGADSTYDFYAQQRYDIADDEWLPLAEAAPFNAAYSNGAVDSESIWVPRDEKMFRFDLETETWHEATSGGLPNGTAVLTEAIFDGDGFIWYAGGGNNLIKYDPEDGTFEEFSYAPDYAGFAVQDGRLAYDPLSDKVLLTGYNNSQFLIFDLTTETFGLSAASAHGWLHDNVCQDRAGGVYVGADDTNYMYRYDVATDAFTQLPVLPLPHDNSSACMVSEVGYLYYGTSTFPGVFARLRLNHH